MSGLKIPTQRHKDDMVIIMALGNLLFKKDGHFSDGGKCHLEGPSYLDDQGASILLGGFSGLIREVSRKFKGKIVVAGPFPRHLADCCNLAEHKIPRSSVFKHPLHYCDMWNRFLFAQPKLRVSENVAFVPFWRIFGERFYNRWLRDGVHLVGDLNVQLAKVFATFPSRFSALQADRPQPLPVADLSFCTWTALQPVQRPADSFQLLGNSSSVDGGAHMPETPPGTPLNPNPPGNAGLAGNAGNHGDESAMDNS